MKYFLSPEFIEKWQTLIGSFLGPFLAVLFSSVGFWIKSARENKKEQKEFLRRIEISVTRSLDDTDKARYKLRRFVSRLRELTSIITAETSDHKFSLDTINFPTIRDIYRDLDVPNFKVGSYYLHNKLLWVDAGIKEINETVINLKNDYIELQRRNELHISLLRQNNSPDPTVQRADYARNLEAFAVAIEGFINAYAEQIVKIMSQVKIYNDHLRRRYGFWFLWKNESTKFKYFRNKTTQRNFSRNLDSLERIDEIIQNEVESAIQEAERRAANM